ncbi:L-histidine N(alpha)-methyltransferase [Algoriphagus hitonicola]|uniref:Dimethylhistidine N-methyltransferase n=1 Tax=Algoriphagus hitonicola TaxID=435880 RepID=A0A1I2T785_9BACT|nr:L-histidine N(alpha)-methyltransferase [Algoriphagus hitonicola]SFG58416.1 dimethylhistidine N-methyltransferase [Algoriphagus hitonicola]
MTSSTQTFLNDVLLGLRQTPKTLSSKYFYDEEGSRIFQEIMDMASYYLPQAELDIIHSQSQAIAELFRDKSVDLIELGAGDGRKMVHFVKILQAKTTDLTYLPLDISESILQVNRRLFEQEIPGVRVHPLAGDFFHTLPEIKDRTHTRIMLFAGSNIGNFRKEKAAEFLRFVREHLQSGDFFLLGVDLKKHPRTIRNAYDDAGGITKKFNLNLLKRINRELGGDFDLSAFDHYATYHPITGASESFLVSLKKQSVNIGEEQVQFEKDEIIQTEISQKYDLPMLENLASDSGYVIDSIYKDSKERFAWVLMNVSGN